jgi:hypothetical protein
MLRVNRRWQYQVQTPHRNPISTKRLRQTRIPRDSTFIELIQSTNADSDHQQFNGLDSIDNQDQLKNPN